MSNQVAPNSEMSRPPVYPLFHVDESSPSKTYLELGRPNPAIHYTSGPCAIYGRYTAESRITFEGKCAHPWEYMATGTGVTGITLSAAREVSGQINHSAAFDDRGKLRSLGRFAFDWYGCGNFYPDMIFSGADKSVRMIHDLRKSLITIISEGEKARISLQVRAHKELDVIRIDVVEESKVEIKNEATYFKLQKDYPFEDRIEGNIYLSWHLNRGDWQTNRCFGTAMQFSVPEGCIVKWESGYCRIIKPKPGSLTAYTLWIAAVSTANSFASWRVECLERISRAQSMGDSFITSHEAWWQDYWWRSALEFPGDDGSHLRHQAAVELYRYQIACSADGRRETPLSFMNDLLRNNQEEGWSCFDFTAMDTYKIWYGTVRDGNLEALGSHLARYVQLQPALERWTKKHYGHEGAVAPHCLTFSHLLLEKGDIQSEYNDNDERPLHLNSNGNLFMLALFCDYVELGGNDKSVLNGFLPYATGVITFFRTHYPRRTAEGKIDFTPSTGDETYYRVSDAADLIAALKMILPRLTTVGVAQSWNPGLLEGWRDFYRDLPELPRGTLRKEDNNQVSLGSGELLIPARCFDRPVAKVWNRQIPELTSVWPGKLMLRSSADLDVARRSFAARLWPHGYEGWALDMVLAACLGLKDEVKLWWPYQFDTTITTPDGFGQENAPCYPDKICCTLSPSMHGLGTAAAAVFEMLLQDYQDLLIVLPCWDTDVAVRYTLYSPYAGKVTVDYDPVRGATVKTERPIKVEFGKGINAVK